MNARESLKIAIDMASMLTSSYLADLTDADLLGSDLRGASLAGADLSRALYVTRRQLGSVQVPPAPAGIPVRLRT
jgi:hypothetical protein